MEGNMVYFIKVMNNINQTGNNVDVLENIGQLFTIANSLLAVVVIIIGLNWLKPLKEKQKAASFTFWSHLYIRLVKISSYIKSSPNCLYYWYSPTVRNGWHGILAPAQDESDQLKTMVEETLSFLEKAEDQMPAYCGWTDDYTNLLHNFTDIIVYDICLSNAKFKFQEAISYSVYLERHKSIYDSIDLMCEKIKAKQVSIEYKITVIWYKRLWKMIKNRLNRIKES